MVGLNLLLALCAAGLNIHYALRFNEYWRWTKLYSGGVYIIVVLLYLQIILDGYPSTIELRTAMTLLLLNGVLGAWTRLVDRRLRNRR
jgi:hypothetical protein